MRNLVHLAMAATLAIGVTANSHQHLHRHPKKDVASKVESHAPDRTVWVAASTATVYQLNEKELPVEDALAGLKNGELIVVGESTPIYTPPLPPPKPTTTTSVQNIGAQFIEKSQSAPPPPKPTTTSQPPSPPPSKSTQAPKPSTPSGGTGLTSEFPSGKVSCSEFPSDFGAVALDHLRMGGFSGLQLVSNFSRTSEFVNITGTGIPGEKCSPGIMCSYACPPGYQKTQWPDAQGRTEESIGGLYCNEKNLLELTRESNPVLCELGAGGVSIQNDLDQVVSTCRTDYPGTESMTIPTEAEPGQTLPLTNTESSTYYRWGGKLTTAQYYVNNKGLAAKDACLWNCPSDKGKDPRAKTCGNWAPVNIGVGMSNDNNTYISVAPNAPTSSAKLDFNIVITGNVTIECSYKDGKFLVKDKDGKILVKDEGCTTTMTKGGKALIRYY